MFVAGSLGVTAASTVAIYRSPTVLRFFNAQGFMVSIFTLSDHKQIIVFNSLLNAAEFILLFVF